MVTEFGIIKLMILFAPLKALAPIVVTPFPIVKLIIPSAPQKAPSAIVRTVSGITTLVILRLSLNAFTPILVTPLGMFTASAQPSELAVTTLSTIVKVPPLPQLTVSVTAFAGAIFKLNKIKVVINVAKSLFGRTGFRFLPPLNNLLY